MLPSPRGVGSSPADANAGRASALAAYVSLLLPAVLVLEFGISFETNDDLARDLNHNMVYLSIGMYIIATQLYRRFVFCDGNNRRNHRYYSAMLNVVPDVTVAAVIAIVYFGYPIAGFLVMMCSMILMAIVVVISCAYELLPVKEQTQPATEPEPDEIDILVV